jgi:hypothetical protein
MLIRRIILIFAGITLVNGCAGTPTVQQIMQPSAVQGMASNDKTNEIKREITRKSPPSQPLDIMSTQSSLPGQYVLYSSPQLEIRADTQDGLLPRKAVFTDKKHYSVLYFINNAEITSTIKIDMRYFNESLSLIENNTTILDRADWIKIANYLKVGEKVSYINQAVVAHKKYIYTMHPVVFDIKNYNLNGVPCFDKQAACAISLNDRINEEYRLEFNDLARKLAIKNKERESLR